jgi:hypothetical protein
MGLLKLERNPFNLPTPLNFFKHIESKLKGFDFKFPVLLIHFCVQCGFQAIPMDESSLMKIHQISR